MLLYQCNRTRTPIFDGNGTANEKLFHSYPSVPKEVVFGLTIGYVVAYCLVYLIVYVQLWMILAYHHKRCSFQTAFLFLCLLWSGLRATLFTFYIQHPINGMELPMFVYWLLYCFPVCLQFFILTLLILYFGQVSKL